MGILGHLTRSAARWLRPRGESHATARRRAPRAYETVERRQLLAANLHIGAVYYEDATGEDLAPDVIEITWLGGAPGTQLTQLTIDTDKLHDGLTIGDTFFDTAVGGRGAFGASGLVIVASTGINDVQAQVSDGASRIVFNFVGFDVGEKFVFSIDVDEVGFLGDNAVAEGNEFEGSQLTATFQAPHFFDVSGDDIFYDAYDANFAGLGLNLPPDSYVPPQSSPQPVRTAGARVALEQLPLPITISGTVYEDRDLDNNRESGEPGIAGVTLGLEKHDGSNYQSTGLTTTTDAQGRYQFDDVLPGRYRVVETQPTGYFSIGATAGRVNSATRGRVDSVNVIADIDLLGGEDTVDNDFGEARPASLAGHVYHDADDDGQLDAGETGIAGATLEIRRRQTDGSFAAPIVVLTDATGFWSATGLEPGVFEVRELQPIGYLDGRDAAGSAGGTPDNPGDGIIGIRLTSGLAGVDYDFGELVPSSISGRVHADSNGDCIYQSGERTLSGVTVYLLDAEGQRINSTLTDSEGRYQFSGLRPGVYGVEEVQPDGVYDGGDHVGSAGGDLVPPDSIHNIMLVSGTVGIDYDFCEYEPVSLCGYVYVDDNENGRFDADEQGLSGVVLALLDAAGQATGTTVMTDANGMYCFTGLAPGIYGVTETQPSGYYDGLDAAGNAGGSAHNPGDRITGARLDPGVYGTDYNFGELRPAGLRGRVHTDRDGDCLYDPEEETSLPGVVVELLDAEGRVVQTTRTDATGQYSFSNLQPGVYGVRELQPAGYFQGGQSIGTLGGLVGGIDLFTLVDLGSGALGQEYNFCELEPVSLHGMVHTDRDGDCLFDPGEEQPLSGVVVELLDANGQVVQSTQTDSVGQYHFSDLEPGAYGIREQQPAGFFQGGQSLGTEGGVIGGVDLFTQIDLIPGTSGREYNFCELEPVSLSGRVHADRDGDCIVDPGELLLSGVTIELLDSSGAIVATTVTDASGSYAFANLAPRTYAVREQQPSGYYDGGAVVGTEGGSTTSPNLISQIALSPGVSALDYNFCELEPTSLGGRVFVDFNGDCLLDEGERPLEGVTIRLLDGTGVEITRTTTSSDGSYRFVDLRPGVYAVIEEQPEGLFQGGVRVGSAGGVSGEDVVEEIALGPGNSATDYDFCERAPAKISGYVFRDGPPITFEQGELPPAASTVRDGFRTSDDEPLAGVVLQLALTGGELVLDASGNPRVAVTDRFGYYEFADLAPGSYTVFEIQPDGYEDFRDTPGTAGGLVANRDDAIPLALAGLEHRFDVIAFIPVDAGDHSLENNFAEVQFREEPIGPPVDFPDPEIPTRAAPPVAPKLAVPIVPAIPPLRRPEDPVYFGGAIRGNTWHLSVINGGRPRTEAPRGEAQAVPVVSRATAFAWGQKNLARGRFVIRQGKELGQIVFGHPQAQPIAGDFNGDGFAEVGAFIDGQWFIDTNANGRFDADDLWAEMGHQGDQPVVGDWDGDGKTDIGIFGPAWARDPRALAAEPGLPDGQNHGVTKPKNLPPTAEEATEPERLLRQSAHGTLRSDFVDHVFQWGTGGDLPVTGDWNGEGITSIGVFRGGVWQLDTDGDGRFTSADLNFQFGMPGDRPVAGDFNGDGRTEVGVYRRGRWHIDSNGNRQLDAQDQVFELGGPGDVPLVADFDGDGADDACVYEVEGSTAAGGDSG